jgi:hypothetical protein
VDEPSLLAQLPARQVEAVRRSVLRMRGGGTSPPTEAELEAAALERAAAQRRLQAMLERCDATDNPWDRVLEAISATVIPQHFATWFRGPRCIGVLREPEGDRLLVVMPSRQFVDWVARCYWHHIERALVVVGRPDLTALLVDAETGASEVVGPPPELLPQTVDA